MLRTRARVLKALETGHSSIGNTEPSSRMNCQRGSVMSAPIAVSYGTPGSRVAFAVAYVSFPEKLWTTMPAGIRFIGRRFSAALAPAAYPAVGRVVASRKSATVVASESVGA